jgi:hypothetical protein
MRNGASAKSAALVAVAAGPTRIAKGPIGPAALGAGGDAARTAAAVPDRAIVAEVVATAGTARDAAIAALDLSRAGPGVGAAPTAHQDQNENQALHYGTPFAEDFLDHVDGFLKRV